MTEPVAGRHRAEPPQNGEFERLLEFIRESRGFDFTGYKRPSLRRRIRKRMDEVGVQDYAGYREYLERTDEEFQRLFDTILINVTGFFRDRPTWDYLADRVLPALVERKDAAEPIRVWSAGCASGEEPYTLAMLLSEALGEIDFRERVKIYATDVDETALGEGRHGIYAARDVEAIPLTLRERYLDAIDSRYILRPEIRRAVIFGRHDLVSDPPISRVDLILCRNTLMYFSPQLQELIHGTFHFALNSSGYLVLGKSEMLLTRTPLFEPLDLRRRVFAPIGGAQARRAAPFAAQPRTMPASSEPAAIREAAFESVNVAQILVDGQGRLALANNAARRLFGLSLSDLGRPLQDLELSYRPVDLRTPIDGAHATHHPVHIRDVAWTHGAEKLTFDVHVSVVSGHDGRELGTSVTFADVTRYKRLESSFEASKERLETAYEELQSTAEELETTNEELQSTNEELETTNEELQSTNEELETMNEELQSTNEELETINDELRLRTDEMNASNAFLASVLASLDSGVVVVGPDMTVRAWNTRAEDLWGLRPDEVEGEHLLGLDVGLPLDPVAGLIRRVLASGETEVADVDAVNRRGRSFRCTVHASRLAPSAGDPGGVILLMGDAG